MIAPTDDTQTLYTVDVFNTSMYISAPVLNTMQIAGIEVDNSEYDPVHNPLGGTVWAIVFVAGNVELRSIDIFTGTVAPVATHQFMLGTGPATPVQWVAPAVTAYDSRTHYFYAFVFDSEIGDGHLYTVNCVTGAAENVVTVPWNIASMEADDMNSKLFVVAFADSANRLLRLNPLDPVSPEEIPRYEYADMDTYLYLSSIYLECGGICDTVGVDPEYWLIALVAVLILAASVIGLALWSCSLKKIEKTHPFDPSEKEHSVGGDAFHQCQKDYFKEERKKLKFVLLRLVCWIMTALLLIGMLVFDMLLLLAVASSVGWIQTVACVLVISVWVSMGDTVVSFLEEWHRFSLFLTREYILFFKLSRFWFVVFLCVCNLSMIEQSTTVNLSCAHNMPLLSPIRPHSPTNEVDLGLIHWLSKDVDIRFSLGLWPSELGFSKVTLNGLVLLIQLMEDVQAYALYVAGHQLALMREYIRFNYRWKYRKRDSLRPFYASLKSETRSISCASRKVKIDGMNLTALDPVHQRRGLCFLNAFCWLRDRNAFGHQAIKLRWNHLRRFQRLFPEWRRKDGITIQQMEVFCRAVGVPVLLLIVDPSGQWSMKQIGAGSAWGMLLLKDGHCMVLVEDDWGIPDLKGGDGRVDMEWRYYGREEKTAAVVDDDTEPPVPPAGNHRLKGRFDDAPVLPLGTILNAIPGERKMVIIDVNIVLKDNNGHVGKTLVALIKILNTFESADVAIALMDGEKRQKSKEAVHLARALRATLTPLTDLNAIAEALRRTENANWDEAGAKEALIKLAKETAITARNQADVHVLVSQSMKRSFSSVIQTAGADAAAFHLARHNVLVETTELDGEKESIPLPAVYADTAKGKPVYGLLAGDELLMMSKDGILNAFKMTEATGSHLTTVGLTNDSGWVDGEHFDWCLLGKKKRFKLINAASEREKLHKTKEVRLLLTAMQSDEAPPWPFRMRISTILNIAKRCVRQEVIEKTGNIQLLMAVEMCRWAHSQMHADCDVEKHKSHLTWWLKPTSLHLLDESDEVNASDIRPGAWKQLQNSCLSLEGRASHEEALYGAPFVVPDIAGNKFGNKDERKEWKRSHDAQKRDRLEELDEAQKKSFSKLERSDLIAPAPLLKPVVPPKATLETVMEEPPPANESAKKRLKRKNGGDLKKESTALLRLR